MATLTVRAITTAGLDPDTPAWDAAAGGGDDFTNDGNTEIEVANGGGSPITVTIPIGNDPHISDPLHSTTDDTVSVPAGEAKRIGPFPQSKYGTSVSIAYSGVTTVTVAAFRM